MKKLSCALAALAVIAFATAGAADPPDRPGAKAARRTPGVPRSVGSTSPGGASFGGTHGSSILGSAWTAGNTPIKQAQLQLRNVVTGHVDALAVANDAGQFAFENVPAGSYVVELISDAGKVQMVGHVFSIAPGETVATFVRAGTKIPWFDGFFNNSVSSVASTAASAGVTAIAPVVRPVSAIY
jgi:hypothetical protein